MYYSSFDSIVTIMGDGINQFDLMLSLWKEMKMESYITIFRGTNRNFRLYFCFIKMGSPSQLFKWLNCITDIFKNIEIYNFKRLILVIWKYSLMLEQAVFVRMVLYLMMEVETVSQIIIIKVNPTIIEIRQWTIN